MHAEGKAEPNFYEKNCELLTVLKTHSTHLENCSTASMAAHSVSILSQLKMCSFGPYTQARRHALHQLRYRLRVRSVEGRSK